MVRESDPGLHFALCAATTCCRAGLSARRALPGGIKGLRGTVLTSIKDACLAAAQHWRAPKARQKAAREVRDYKAADVARQFFVLKGASTAVSVRAFSQDRRPDVPNCSAEQWWSVAPALGWVVRNWCAQPFHRLVPSSRLPARAAEPCRHPPLNFHEEAEGPRLRNSMHRWAEWLTPSKITLAARQGGQTLPLSTCVIR